MEILETVKHRKGTRWGIGTASVYLSQQGVKQFATAAGEKDWDALLKRAEGQLTFCSPDMQVTATKRGDTEAWSPNAAYGDLPTWTKDLGSVPGAIMEFECVVTSNREDRDGDILEPRGATLDPRAPLLLHQQFPGNPALAGVNQNDGRAKAGHRGEWEE